MNRSMNDGEKRSVLDEAAEWYFRRDAGPLSPLDEASFRQWLARSGNRAAFEEIAGTWSDLALIERPSAEGEVQRAGRVEAPWAGRNLKRIAAALIAVAAVGYSLDMPTRLRADAYTATGETKTLALDDGSSVTLNTASAIAVDYSHDARRVRLLRGEAVFTVAKDTARPFLVDTAGGEARALGTAFAVRLVEEGATVVVLESRVGVSYPAGASPAVELSPGEAVHFSSAGMGQARRVDADAETAWRRGKLIFVDRRLGDVIAELNRYHSGRIQITDGSIGNQRVSGVFDTADPVRVLDALEGALGLRSTRLTSYLILLHR
jgi:transmembrane sensor